MDRILLQGMQFYAYHGVNPEEKASGQRFQVDLEAELDLEEAGRTDDLNHTVNYAHLYRTVKEVMDGAAAKPPWSPWPRRLPTLSLDRFPIQAVRVKVTKASPPIKGAIVSGAAVEIYRTRPRPTGCPRRPSLPSQTIRIFDLSWRTVTSFNGSPSTSSRSAAFPGCISPGFFLYSKALGGPAQWRLG